MLRYGREYIIPRCVVVLGVVCCLLFATGAFAAVSVDPSYSTTTDTWNYHVTMTSSGDLGTFYVYMDPNM